MNKYVNKVEGIYGDIIKHKRKNIKKSQGLVFP